MLYCWKRGNCKIKSYNEQLVHTTRAPGAGEDTPADEGGPQDRGQGGVAGGLDHVVAVGGRARLVGPEDGQQAQRHEEQPAERRRHLPVSSDIAVCSSPSTSEAGAWR